MAASFSRLALNRQRSWNFFTRTNSGSDLSLTCLVNPVGPLSILFLIRFTPTPVTDPGPKHDEAVEKAAFALAGPSIQNMRPSSRASSPHRARKINPNNSQQELDLTGSQENHQEAELEDGHNLVAVYETSSTTDQLMTTYHNLKERLSVDPVRPSNRGRTAVFIQRSCERGR